MKKLTFIPFLLLFIIVAGVSGCVYQDIIDTDVNYTQEDVDYFEAVAFGSEYGSSDTGLTKWDEDIRVKIIGSPTPEDQEMVNYTISELDDYIDGLTITLDSDNPNMEIYFVPGSEFSEILPSYVPGNDGFYYIWWDSNKEIYRSVILINTEIDQTSRSHLIIHEITQSMGLGIDSPMYPESIFNELPSQTTRYAEIDKAVIKMLYQRSLKAGMSKEEVMEILNQNKIP